MALSPSMSAALSRNRLLLFLLVAIDAPTFSIHLCDGGSSVVVDGLTFYGGDDTYGALNAVEGLSDGITDEAPSCTITINPPTNIGAADLSSPTTQGALVSVSLGAMDPDTGIVQGTYLWFFGVVDHCTLKTGAQRTLQIECVTAWEAFFEQDNGTRLSNSWHQFVWPGERGLEYVIDVNRTLPWGAENTAAPPAIPNVLKNTVIGRWFGR